MKNMIMSDGQDGSMNLMDGNFVTRLLLAAFCSSLTYCLSVCYAAVKHSGRHIIYINVRTRGERMTPGKEELEGRCTRRRMRCGELIPVRKNGEM